MTQNSKQLLWPFSKRATIPFFAHYALFLFLSLTVLPSSVRAENTVVDDGQAVRQARQQNAAQILAEHPDAVAYYECARDKVVAVNSNKQNSKSTLDITDPKNSEYTPSEFAVVIVRKKPNEHCSSNYYDQAPFMKWKECLAKYTIASDGYKFQPRSYNLPLMKSDDGHTFHGDFGGYFHVAGKGLYVIEYSGEGERFLETGTCQQKK